LDTGLILFTSSYNKLQQVFNCCNCLDHSQGTLNLKRSGTDLPSNFSASVADVRNLSFNWLTSIFLYRELTFRWNSLTNLSSWIHLMSFYLELNLVVSRTVALLISGWTAQEIHKKNSVALSPHANYTDWAAATCRRNVMPTSVDRGVSRGQRGGSPKVVNLSFLHRSRYFSFK
jgi:hypothetical protein